MGELQPGTGFWLVIPVMALILTPFVASQERPVSASGMMSTMLLLVGTTMPVRLVILPFSICEGAEGFSFTVCYSIVAVGFDLLCIGMAFSEKVVCCKPNVATSSWLVAH